jgi:hypothetical protein
MLPVDRAVRAGIARLTGGLAPSALAGAFLDWAVHLAASPGKQLELAGQAVTAMLENALFASACAGGAKGDPAAARCRRIRSRGQMATLSVQRRCPIHSFRSSVAGAVRFSFLNLTLTHPVGLRGSRYG